MAIYYLDKDKLFPQVKKRLMNTEVALDIGCGIRPQNLIRPRTQVCVEPYGEYVEKLQEKVKNEFDRSYVILKATWEEIVKALPSKSVDTVFLLDVIEHLEKRKALRLLKRTEGLARVQIVIFTPLGFIPQRHPGGKDAWGFKGGHWQEHKSGWSPSDFDESWDIYVSEKYHYEDNLGRKYPKPHGAFFALKDLSGTMRQSKKLQSLSRLHSWKIISSLRQIRMSLPILKKL